MANDALHWAYLILIHSVKEKVDMCLYFDTKPAQMNMPGFMSWAQSQALNLKLYGWAREEPEA